MSTRRERLEARLERRQAWAESRKQKAAQAFDAARETVAGIPPGQPILIGHHSEKRHRATLRRADAKMAAGIESANMAKHHEGRAAGLADHLERSTFSDDPDALEQLAQRIAEAEAERELMKKGNAAYKKGGARAFIEAVGPELARKGIRTMELSPWEKRPFPSYALSNLGANIRRLQARVVDVKRRQERQARAEAAGGVVIELSPCTTRAQVTFNEYPGRRTVDALKAAGFHWSGGSWFGLSANLPEDVKEAATNAGS